MSTTDTRAAFEAWAELTTSQTKGALHEVTGWYYFDDLTNDRWEAWQAATEAAKATGTAGELPPLPFWTKRDDLGGLVPSEVRQEMREYGQACAEAARQPAPVVAVKTWQERAGLITGKEIVVHNKASVAYFMQQEIADLRAVLAIQQPQDERAAFEEWMRKTQGAGCKRHGEDYLYSYTNFAWLVWQARAALAKKGGAA